MKRYYIIDENNNFWCENNFGYWSSFEDSKRHMFEGNIFWVLPLFLMMKISKVECKLREIRKNELIKEARG